MIIISEQVTVDNYEILFHVAEAQRKSANEVIRIKGNLNLPFLTSIRKLPDNLHVCGYLSLCKCTSLINLPKKLYIDGSLLLYGCTSIIKLPNSLHVKG